MTNVTAEYFEHAATGRVVANNQILGRGIRRGRHFVVQRTGWTDECFRVVFDPVMVDVVVDNSTTTFPAGTFLEQPEGGFLPIGEKRTLLREVTTVAYRGAGRPERFTWPAGTVFIRASYGSPEFAGSLGIISR